MTNVTPIYQRFDYADVMTTKETAQLLRCSDQTVRSLTLREVHPLPYANTGTRHRIQRVFHRPAVLQWIEEEAQMTRGPAAERANKPAAKAG
jgi:excisionase family DNA binding protein